MNGNERSLTWVCKLIVRAEFSQFVCTNSNGEWKVQHATAVTGVHGTRPSYCHFHCRACRTASGCHCGYQRGLHFSYCPLNCHSVCLEPRRVNLGWLIDWDSLISKLNCAWVILAVEKNILYSSSSSLRCNTLRSDVTLHRSDNTLSRQGKWLCFGLFVMPVYCQDVSNSSSCLEWVAIRIRI